MGTTIQDSGGTTGASPSPFVSNDGDPSLVVSPAAARQTNSTAATLGVGSRITLPETTPKSLSLPATPSEGMMPMNTETESNDGDADFKT